MACQYIAKIILTVYWQWKEPF